ncbi:MAG: hypothetical protein M3044_07480 [Thermoproteota archaeon]|nr:hypothetical protein [Thermoproteota archaeon]
MAFRILNDGCVWSALTPPNGIFSHPTSVSKWYQRNPAMLPYEYSKKTPQTKPMSIASLQKVGQNGSSKVDI